MKNLNVNIRYALIIAIAIALMSIFSCKEDEPLPTYEIVPIVNVANTGFGVGNVESVKLTIHVVEDGKETIIPRELKVPNSDCPVVQAFGNPIDYKPMVLEFWAEVYFKFSGQDGYVLVTNHDRERNRTTVALTFLVRDKDLHSDRYVGLMKRPEFLSYGFPKLTWNVGEFTLSGKSIDDTGSINIEDCSCISEENKLY